MVKKGICESVGALIKNGKGEYLVLYRLQKPVGLALPAGHIETHEDSGDAIRRAVLEKTGVRIINIKRAHERLVEANCRLGFTTHWWYVYDVLSWEGAPELKQPRRHKFVKFMSLAEMKSFVDKKEMLIAWSKFILKDMGIL